MPENQEVKWQTNFSKFLSCIISRSQNCFFFCFMVPGIESQYQASQCVLCELFSKYDRACKQNTSENISSKNGEFQVRPEGKNSLNIGKS